MEVGVERPANVESTVLGAALLAGRASGLYKSLDDIAKLWRRESVFEPQMDMEQTEKLYAGWLDAVSRVRSANTIEHTN